MAINIVDIFLAKKKAQGEAAEIMAGAQQALAEATAANEDIGDILDYAETAENRMSAISAEYDDIKADIEGAVDTAAASIVDTRIATATNELVTGVEVVSDDTASAKKKKIRTRKKNQTTTDTEVVKNYTTTGQNEDGAMTQKAITAAIKAVEDKIPEHSSSGSDISVGDAAPGTLVVVGENGGITAGTTTEDDIIDMQIALGKYDTSNTIGITIDYLNRSVTRLSNIDFNKHSPFGGRKRCTVADNGSIIAFEGELGYVEDGSNGQVMVYQPKFYYRKNPTKTTTIANGERIDAETLIISSIKQSGLTIHPLFLDANGQEVDYVLLSAYEGCAYDTSANTYNLTDTQDVDFSADKLSSIAGAKPISGATQTLTCNIAAQLANNRGAGWCITDITFESMNQLLMELEFGALNIQTAFNLGCTSLATSTTKNISCLTGSTQSLGSTTGRATTSQQTIDNNSYTQSDDGKCSISYRGLENPYGNMWRFIGGTTITGASDINTFTYTNHQGQTTTLSYKLPSRGNWISGFGYDATVTWLNIPIEAQSTANSAVPIGDYIHIPVGLNTTNICVAGGSCVSNVYAGPFNYGCDRALNFSGPTFSARLMHIPTANSTIHNNNVVLWKTKVGSDLDD